MKKHDGNIGMNNLMEAINIVLGSSKSYIGSENDCETINRQLPEGERCVSVINFAVENPKMDIAINMAEFVILRQETREQYLQGIVTSRGELVYHYFVSQEGELELRVDVNGDWKQQLMYVALELDNE